METMLEQLTRVNEDDDPIVEALLAAVPDAHRLATWIVRDATAGEDAVQEALLQAWRRRRSFDPRRGSLDAWFGRIVVNVCRDELRRRARRPATAAIRSIDLPGPDHSDRAAEYDDLARAIGRLSEDEQVLLGLRFGRDLTVPQIAVRLAIPEGTVKSRLHNALEHIRAVLAAEERSKGTTR